MFFRATTCVDTANTLDGFYNQINALLGYDAIAEFEGHAFVLIGDLEAAANLALSQDGITQNGDVNRAFQEALKNALDALNNNQLLVID
jgi:hypothetical protein